MNITQQFAKLHHFAEKDMKDKSLKTVVTIVKGLDKMDNPKRTLKLISDLEFYIKQYDVELDAHTRLMIDLKGYQASLQPN